MEKEIEERKKAEESNLENKSGKQKSFQHKGGHDPYESWPPNLFIPLSAQSPRTRNIPP